MENINCPILSIIVPVYNVANYLENCIDSILKQTFSEFELILVNDGSTDNSPQICDDYAAKDSRVKVIHGINQGVSEARNRGLDLAQGKYVTFVDSDDSISSDTYKKNIALLQEMDYIDVLQYPCVANYGTSNPMLRAPKDELIQNTKQAFYSWLKEKTITNYVWNKIYKTQIFSSLRFKRGMFYEDRYLINEILIHCKTIYISTKGCYYYYCREGQTTSRQYSQIILQSLILADMNIVKHLRKLNILSEVLLERFSNCVTYRQIINTKTWHLCKEAASEMDNFTPSLKTILNFNTKVPIGIRLNCIKYKFYKRGFTFLLR